MLKARTSRPARLTVLGAVMAAASIAPAAVAAQPAPATIDFQAATAGGDQYSRTTIGTFSTTGPFADAGTVRMSYRFAGPRVHATAILIGARGVFTLTLRGASGATVGEHQSGAGHWRVCGGTEAYLRLHGHGSWEADTDFGAGPTGMLLPAISGAFTGHLYRSAHPRHHASC
jgi:hypothetical protein